MVDGLQRVAMRRTETTLIDRRDYLRLAGGVAAAATGGLAGCSSSVPGTGSDGDGTGGGSGSDGSTATGLLSTAVSDQPGDIGDFESCIVTIDGIWVGPEVGGSGDGSNEEDGEESGGENETDARDGDDTNETEQDDGGGPPADAPGGSGRSSSDDEASGSQDGNETDADGGNQTEVDAPDQEEPSGNESDAEDEESEEDGESEDENESGVDGEDGNGRTYYEFDEPQEADLTELQGEAQQLVGEHELSVGTYQFLQLDISGIRGTLTDGSEAAVETPGNAPLKFNQSFDVREGYRTTFLADFTPVKRGNGSYLFQPVASETEVSYHEIESDDSESGDGDATESDDGNTTTDGNTTGAEEGSGSDGENSTETDDGSDGTTAGGYGTAADGGNQTA